MRTPHFPLVKTAAIAGVGALSVFLEGHAVVGPVHTAASRLVAQGVERLVSAAGLPTYLDGTTVHSIGYSLQVVPDCDGLTATAIVLAGVILLRASARVRVGIAACALIAAFGINVVRIATILVIGTRSPTSAEFVHGIVFPLLVFGMFALLWLQWLKRETSCSMTMPVDRA